MRTPGNRVWLGSVPLDSFTLEQAITRIAELARTGGGTVFTPNVDHIVVAEERADFRAAYADVSVSLVDGTPVYWATRLLRLGVPEKVSGSDLFEPLVERARDLDLPIYLLGGAEGVAELARTRLLERYPGLKVAGWSAPRLDEHGVLTNEAEELEKVRRSGANIVFVACGAPKSELFCFRTRRDLAPAVLVCVGAAIDFCAGTARRAPRWMSRAGLEWAFRLAQEPGRLAFRYLVRDPKFLWILARNIRITS